eukprot:1590859-Pleurochrysis_carterae.AAC.5
MHRETEAHQGKDVANRLLTSVNVFSTPRNSAPSWPPPAFFTKCPFMFAPERPVALEANRSVAIRALLATALHLSSAEAVVPPRRNSVLLLLSTLSPGANMPPSLTLRSVAARAMLAAALLLPSVKAVVSCRRLSVLRPPSTKAAEPPRRPAVS